jgi:hypothetical protein
MKNKKDLFKHDLDYIEMAKATGVYGTDWHNDLLEFAYMVAEHTKKQWQWLADDEVIQYKLKEKNL